MEYFCLCYLPPDNIELTLPYAFPKLMCILLMLARIRFTETHPECHALLYYELC